MRIESSKLELALSDVGLGWKAALAETFESKSFQRLQDFLRFELASGHKVFPPLDLSFRALQLVDLPDVRVVILGQDPYHGEGQANGLAFAVPAGVKPPPSLRNIFKEIHSDLGLKKVMGTTLEGWAQQGVLLLNNVLTVRAHEAFSHRGKGWEELTEKIVRVLNARPEPIVFMLWGSAAQQKSALVTSSHHLVLKAAHPSPLSAHRGFFGCRHFSQANEFLRQTNRSVDWLKTDPFDH